MRQVEGKPTWGFRGRELADFCLLSMWREKQTERKPVRKEQEGNRETDQVFPAPRRPQLSELGLGPRASEAGVRREPPSAAELDGYAGRLSTFRPKPQFPRHTTH